MTKIPAAGLCLLVVLSSCGGSRMEELFEEAAETAGLRFVHFNGATGQYFMPEILGPGAALFDYDGDGDLDVYLVQGTFLEPGKTLQDARFPPAAGWKPGNRMFRNEQVPSGKLQFTDVTEQSGTGLVAYGMGVAVGDYDGDGDPDLYVTNLGPNVLFRNNGDGTFTNVTEEAGVGDPRWSTSASFLDYDRDGDLDLVWTNYVNFAVAINKTCRTSSGEPDYCGPKSYGWVPDRLFRNEGGGRFVDAGPEAGVVTKPGPGLGILSADFDGDGWPDLYVANDGAANHLWINQRDGTFREAGLVQGAAYSADGLAKAGMGVTAADVDNDGDEDIVVTNLDKEGCTIFRNSGKGDFLDSTLEFGLREPTFPFTGFGVGWFDYDNDGLLDLFVANGAVYTMESQRGTPFPFLQKNLLIRNEGEGRRMRDVTGEAGAALQLREVSRAAVFGDIDNDGDVDVLVTNNNGPVRLLLNKRGSRRNWLRVRLEGSQGNPGAYGARVELSRDGQPALWRRVQTDSSYLAANDARVHFGLGDGGRVKELVVHWPDGSEDRLNTVPVKTEILVRQGQSRSLASD